MFKIKSLFILLSVLGFFYVGTNIPSVHAATTQWPQYLHDLALTANSSDTTLNASNAANLTKLWSYKTGGVVAASPTIVNGVVYVGSWDGNEYALNASTGAVLWQTFLGKTVANCAPQNSGVSSAAAVQNGVVYVGGGDSYWYALDANTGAILWKVFTGDNSITGGHYNWASPIINNGYAYIGIASLGDCPLVQGQLLKVNLSTHLVENTLNLVPNGRVGGGIWTTPALDVSTNTIFLSTGTENGVGETYAQAIVAINASTMTISDSWKLPSSVAVPDSDFGTSAILFTDANNNKLVAAINKNGVLYAFNRSNLHAGPVWQQSIAEGGDCVVCGQASVSSGTFMNGSLFFAGNDTVIQKRGYIGSVRSINPATGAVQWEHPAQGQEISALASANGLIYSGAGSVFEVLDARNGHRIYSYDTGSTIYASPSIANGVIYVGNTYGYVTAFALPSVTPPPPPIDPQCPRNWYCQDINSGLPSGNETISTNNSWTVSAGGNGIQSIADGFRYMYQSQSGDTQVAAQITSQQNTNANAQAGLMIRQNNDPASPFYSLLVTPTGLKVIYRSSFGSAAYTANTVTTSLPQYYAIQRIGDTFQAATSSDGVSYQLVGGSMKTLVIPYTMEAGIAQSSAISGTNGTDTYSFVSTGQPVLNFQPIPPHTACPINWNCQDIGAPEIVGDQSLTGSTWSVSGAGGDIWGLFDEFHFVSQILAADASLQARIVSQTSPNAGAKTGIMFRQNTSRDAAYYAVFHTPGSGLVLHYRTQSGWSAKQLTAITGSLPAFVKITRSGSTMSTYTSTDGTNWLPVAGSTVIMTSLDGPMLAGLAITSHNILNTNTGSLDSVSVTNSSPPPPTVCPAGWACNDIGFPTPQGDQILQNNVWTVQGGGGDIYSNSDAFRYISQTTSTDGVLVTHVGSQTSTNPSAKSGLMFRQTLDPASPYYALFTMPLKGVVIQYRSIQGGLTTQITASPSGSVPLWLKITHTGTTFASSISTDGKTWTAINNSGRSIPGMTGLLNEGMAVTSHDTLNVSTVSFDSFTFKPILGCPSSWSCLDIGSPAVSGSIISQNNSYTVQGGGNDIWGTTDQFYYASQPLIGDGSITARMVSQSNTSPWAKAGVMMKESTTALAKYVAVMATPTNGTHMQYNFNGDSILNAAQVTYPTWLRLTRSGNVFTPYTSTDGITWTAGTSTTLVMQQNVTMGLFVNSHNGSTLGSVVFDNVSPAPAIGPTSTPTPMISITATPTPTSTPTLTPTPTSTPTITPTPSGSAVQLSNLQVFDTSNNSYWSFQSNLQIGNKQYGDRGYTFVNLPGILNGAAWIRTANNSRTFTSTQLLTFTINHAATVYVATDIRLAQPSWIDSTWTKTGLTLTDNQASSSNTFIVYTKTFPAGSVSLGPNGTGSTGVNMYSVFVQ